MHSNTLTKHILNRTRPLADNSLGLSGIAALFLFFIIASPCLAQKQHADSLRPATQDNLDKPVLDVVVFAGNYPPFNIQKDGDIGGLGPNLASEVFKRMNLPFTLRALPWNRAMDTIRENEADAVLSLFKTPKRETFLVYPDEHLFMESNSFFARKRSKLRYDGDLSNFKILPISVVEGYSYGPKVDNADFLDFRPSVGDEKMIRMVIRGRYLLGIGNRHVVSYYANKEGRADEIEFLEPLVTNSPAYLAFSKRVDLDGRLASKFSRELKAFKKTQKYRDLLTGYGID